MGKPKSAQPKQRKGVSKKKSNKIGKPKSAQPKQRKAVQKPKPKIGTYALFDSIEENNNITRCGNNAEGHSQNNHSQNKVKKKVPKRKENGRRMSEMTYLGEYEDVYYARRK
ncbi:uncharacterized protein LOC124140901 isoform X2 [Haliotis rufescens]|nr:uncharacterized protein LOC124140901 isoform X2 [Haliotis rufescens]